ncbi:hypothetical protein CHRYSEOSP005_17480 [Chryseobacterium sp. Alg-005]|uniref:hypothetical protein n=1 Tax=Chryseobacterium sp. Alg-005 TaxID=3159516 RepID=UPI0035559036
MKKALLLMFMLVLFVFASGCKPLSATKNPVETESIRVKNNNEVKFSEVRRLNKDVSLQEYMIIRSFEETVKLYRLLEDKRFSRSEPIPTLAENEFILLLKPELKIKQYGDIEVVKIEESQSVLNVYYKEIDNEEYSANKQKNPILILIVEGKIPSRIKLMPINS